MWRVVWLGGVVLGCGLLIDRSGGAELSVGLGEVEITPDVAGPKPVWIAGYGQNRQATAVHDPLLVRAVVLKSAGQQVALVSVDVVGLQYPTVQEIRSRLTGYDYVLVSATHNHEGPDTMGIWGPSPFRSGVDPDYMRELIERAVQAVAAADAAAVPVQVFYGTAQDDALLRDSREPYVYDGVLRALRFVRPADGKTQGLLVQWNCHPEAMGGDNTVITADFPQATVARLREKYNCPVAYFTGVVGGLMAPPRDQMKGPDGQLLREGDFEFARIYGEAVGDLAAKAIEAGSPIELTPFVVSAKPITLPLANPLYKAARMMGVLKRDGRVWTGDFEELGPLVGPKDRDKEPAAESEVAYLGLGELHVACIPGELYPELVYGQFQEPVDPGADFPEAPLETPVVEALPGDKLLVIGLANDELGYIVPKRQWDDKPPFCYGREKSQYGEENSLGPETAPIVMQALVNRVREAQGKAGQPSASPPRQAE